MVTMTIKGVGIDSVLISRIEDALVEAEHFFQKNFSENERSYCSAFADPATHYAGTFAAKEAVRKATGEFSRAFSEIEIIRDALGKPEVWMDGARRSSIHISITHTRDDASAIAIFES